MSDPVVHTFGHQAMATRFDLRLVHADEAQARNAAGAVIEDIDRLERELSRHIPWSDISRINGSPAGREVLVHEAAMDCLSYGQEIWKQTGGAFDVTVGPLLQLLRWPNGLPRKAEKAELEAARARCGYERLTIQPEEFLVIPQVDDMLLDLGAIGKGYALDQAAIILREDWGITDFLLNAGTSTLLASGALPGHDGWLVRAGGPEPFLLKDQAVSGTGFEIQGAHVIDPRRAKLVDVSRVIRWAVAPNATLADALSTAFMVMNRREIAKFVSNYPDVTVLYFED